MTAPSAGHRGIPDVLDTGFLKLVSIAFLLLGAIFGLMQPVASVGLGPAGAVVFWMLHAAAAIPCLVAAVWWLARLPLRLRPWVFVAVSGLIAAVGFSLAALGLEFAFAVQDNDPSEPVLLESWGFIGLWLDEFSGVAPPFLLAWVLINLPRLMRLGLSTGSVPATPAPPEPQPPAEAAANTLLDQLPEALGTDLVLLSSDLHYLHVHTPRGRTMLLYNLSAAEAELGGRGTRVHRSHWVASHHVLGLRRRGSQLVCQLTGGLEAPVSRRRQAEIVARFGRDSRYRPPVPNLSGQRSGTD